MGRKKRSAVRHIKRLEVEFSAGDKAYKGFLSNISGTGIFIRTSRSFMEGSEIDVKIYLPADKISQVKGIVRRATAFLATNLVKNGMGIELTHKDQNFIDFVNFMDGEGGRTTEEADKIKEPPDALSGPKEEAEPPKPETKEVEFLIITCQGCGVKNKVPADKLSLGPRCGGCREPLQTE